MRRPKTNFHRFRTMQKLLSSEPQSKLQSFGSGQGTGGNAGMSVEKLANELAMDGTKAVNMQTHYESACHQEVRMLHGAVSFPFVVCVGSVWGGLTYRHNIWKTAAYAV
jgi:hypothetical protein